MSEDTKTTAEGEGALMTEHGGSAVADHPAMTINEDGSPVLIEAVWYRYGAPYIEEFDSTEEAQSFLDSGEDYGEYSSVGVFVDGKPHSCGPWDWHPPLTEGCRNVEMMRDAYRKARGVSSRHPDPPDDGGSR